MDTLDDARTLWTLDPGVAYLNHGSFGACPRPVLERQSRLRERMEAEPVRFLFRDLEGLLDEARFALAEFLGADPEGLAFVPNATTGVNTVLHSVDLRPGDEVLATDQEYPAVRNALDKAVRRWGASLSVAPLPFPLSSPAVVAEAILSRVTPRTRLAVLDHVTSPTALVLPLGDLLPELRALGVRVLVDGAHAPGQLPLDLRALGADYYTGNCHKWLCAPKGAAFLHIREDRRAEIHPPVVSHGSASPRADRARFRLEFDWTGTADPTPFLCVPECIRLLGGLLPEGWPALMARNRALALEARRLLLEALGEDAPCPDSMVGSMASVPLPGARAPRVPPLLVDTLQERLWEEHRVEVPVIPWPHHPARLLRISCQVYNEAHEYRRLAALLSRLLEEEAS